MTVHSTFRLGINVEVGVIPPIQLDSYFGRRITQADVLIIDEITMLNKIIFENVDLLCRTLNPERMDVPFGGKVVILSGDWKQSLPVVTLNSSTVAQVAASLQSSGLYQQFQKISRTKYASNSF